MARTVARRTIGIHIGALIFGNPEARQYPQRLPRPDAYETLRLLHNHGDHVVIFASSNIQKRLEDWLKLTQFYYVAGLGRRDIRYYPSSEGVVGYIGLLACDVYIDSQRGTIDALARENLPFIAPYWLAPLNITPDTIGAASFTSVRSWRELQQILVPRLAAA